MRLSSVAVLMCAILVAHLSNPAAAAYTRSASSSASSFGTTTLLAPTSLAAATNANVLNCKVTITWTDPQAGVSKGWAIQRFIGTTPDSAVTHLPAAPLSYVDSTGLQLATLYTWKVVATSGTNWVSPSAEVTRLVTIVCL